MTSSTSPSCAADPLLCHRIARWICNGEGWSASIDKEVEALYLSDPGLFKILSDYWAVRDEQHPAIYLERGLWRVIYLDNGAGGVGGGVCEASYKTLREAMHLYSEKYGR